MLRVSLVALVAGCQAPERRVDAGNGEHLIWVFPGVEGGSLSIGRAVRAYRDGGVQADVEVLDWERPLGLISNLVAIERNRQYAAQVAEQITEFRRHHPKAAIDLVGYSGGGGVAILTAEALPEDIRVRHIILVQAAISPSYYLTAALRHVDGRLVNFYCPSDWFMLGVGTSLFGTIDRSFTASAGKSGFVLESAVPDEALRAKVVQVKWSEEMRSAGHNGGHRAILRYAWNRRYVAPWLNGMANVE